ncbi:MAG: hypothetical protein HQ402_01295 [Parcubacteria group bacterium]|nr:hypothetical protein [Parcubacteria group bacterium]
MFIYYTKKGMGLVEVLVAVSIVTAFIVVLVSVHTLYLKTAFSNMNTVKSAFLLEEGVEAVKFMRDASWSANIASLVSGTTYYLDFTGTSWQSTNSNIYIDDVFERKFVIDDVYRDATTKDIVTSGGSLDAGTKKVTVYLSWWSGTSTTTKSIPTYITDII